MLNPALGEFRRSLRLAMALTVALSFTAAFSHFLLTIDQRLARQSRQLEQSAIQLDQQLSVLNTIADWWQQQARVNLSNQTDLSFNLYKVDGQLLSPAALLQDKPQTAAELRFLQAQQSSLMAMRLLYPWIESLFYVSEQDFIYLLPQQGLSQLHAYHSALEANWNQLKEPLQFSKAENNKLLFSRWLSLNTTQKARLLFVIDMNLLFQPLQKMIPEAEFILLDDEGKLLGSTLAITPQLDEQLLQLQRVGRHSLSLVMLEQRRGILSLGMQSFFHYWFGYLLVLSLMVMVFFYRLRQKILQPLKRLSMHIERLTRNQGGVRHIPSGWEEMFDKITRLKP